MSLSVNLTAKAKRDVRIILSYIQKRSRRGAEAWYRRWLEVLERLAETAPDFGIAAEDEDHEVTIRQAVFKTRRGLPYRALFIVREEKVFVLHVRGPGQADVAPDNMEFPS